jgi:TPP-dependent pyruvate/acetoin dehydrogenase alpha subunit
LKKSAEQYTKSKTEGFAFVYWRKAVAVGVMQALTEEDNVLCTYREHGHALARGIDADVIIEMYGKKKVAHWVAEAPCIYLTFQKLLWRQCYRQQSFTAGCRNGFSFQKQKKDNITCCFFWRRSGCRRRISRSDLAALWEVPVICL